MPNFDFPADSYPLVVAHRGASAHQPENTLPSFEAALQAGADAVELDVRLTSDGVPVVMHDADVARSTNGRGLVCELTLSEVKSLDAGRDGTPAEVPTVAEVLELVSGRAGVNFEIKNIPGEQDFDSPREGALMGALEALDRTTFSGPVLVSSFNWLTIERCREVAPDIPTGFLAIAAVSPHASLVYVRDAGHAFVLPQASSLLAAGESVVHDAHQSGIRVGTWTVDDPETLLTLLLWGVDAVASNDPAGAIDVRSRVRASKAGE